MSSSSSRYQGGAAVTMPLQQLQQLIAIRDAVGGGTAVEHLARVLAASGGGGGPTAALGQIDLGAYLVAHFAQQQAQQQQQEQQQHQQQQYFQQAREECLPLSLDLG